MNEESRGLGDTIAKATRVLGISPCGGCKERQAWLNEKFPYERTEMANAPVSANRVTEISDVKAGCVYFPPQQPIILGCPVCGVRLEFTPVDGMLTRDKITLPSRIKFSCGWSGTLINSEWIGK
jgi:hypothetical protein